MGERKYQDSVKPSGVFMVSEQMIDYRFEGLWETVILREHMWKHRL